jgi:hypothetical protein
MEQTQHPSGSPWRNFYGRFKGKTLRPAQIEALDEDLERLERSERILGGQSRSQAIGFINATNPKRPMVGNWIWRWRAFGASSAFKS